MNSEFHKFLILLELKRPKREEDTMNIETNTNIQIEKSEEDDFDFDEIDFMSEIHIPKKEGVPENAYPFSRTFQVPNSVYVNTLSRKRMRPLQISFH